MMELSERKLRVRGYIVFTSIFFVFFMLEMFFSWHGENLMSKVLLLTIIHTLLIWEPTRFIILFLRKKFPGSINVKRRIALASAILVPYAFLLGTLRIFIEDYSNLWGVPIATFATYSYTIGISLLFILLELAIYESVYFFTEWNKSRSEAEELKRLNVQIQIDSLKLQIQPHFLFNTLNTLIGLIEADKTRAVHFTEDLAHVYRYLLETTQKPLINLEDEMDFTRRYFSLLKTRYPEGLHLTETLHHTTQYRVPPLALQVLIENAVKHNKISRLKPLYIQINYDDSQQRIVVVNNLQCKDAVISTGMGLQHLKKKFQLLNLPDLHIKKDVNEFAVSFPVVKNEAYESVDY